MNDNVPPLPASKPSVVPLWRRSAGLRVLWFFLLMIVFQGIAAGLSRLFGVAPNDLKTMHGNLPATLLGVLPFVLAYWVLARFVERRPLAELSWRKLPQLLPGLLAALLLFALVTLELWSAGAYRITGFGDAPLWSLFLLTAVGPGIGEEIFTRGILFRLAEESLGTWWALLVSALFFGFAHIANPGATVWSSLAIMIEAGLLFGMLYHVTRSLWWCIGLHAGWNFMQGAVFGIPVSGIAVDGLIESQLEGPDWLDGGGFGAEASVLTVLTCSIATLWMIRRMQRNGSRVLPYWKRAKREDAPPAALQ
ncbi:MAG: CPBP family intramembrane metalloprotease [Pseudoxanthomonas sp.]